MSSGFYLAYSSMKLFLNAQPNSFTASVSLLSSTASGLQKSMSMSEFSEYELEQIEPIM